MNKSIAKKIIDYMDNKVSVQDNPRCIGKGLSLNKAGLWRYRVGDYRIICQIQDDQITILVLEAGHRKDVYN